MASRRLLLSSLLALEIAASGVSLGAHHSYAAYDREHPVSIEGNIEHVVFANPHTILVIRVADTEYVVEWGSILQLQRSNIAKDTLKVGDRVLVTGSAFRNQAVHKMSLLTQIRRPADGWVWSRQLPPSILTEP